MKIKCWLFGCGDLDFEDYEQCHRCGAHLYDGDWIENGWLLSLIYWVECRFHACKRRVFGYACNVCGKRFHSGANYWSCSPECEEKSTDVPF